MAVCQLFENQKIEFCMSIKSKKTDTDTYEDSKRCTKLVVKDITLRVTKNNMGKKFFYWGRITHIYMVVKDSWQTAHIIYKSQSSLETFHTIQ